MIETKARAVPRERFPAVLDRIADNVLAVGEWAPDFPVRGCLVLFERFDGRRDYEARGIAMLTPDDVHHHRARSVLEQRGRTLQAAWTRHPERFVRGIPEPEPFPEAVWITPPVTSRTGETAQ